MPSLAQMACRCLPFHRQCLQLRSEGKRIDRPSWTSGDFRGALTAMRTLSRWGCVDANGITDLGRELLELLNARAAVSK